MPVDRKLFREPFFRDYLPGWPCARCKRGHLQLLKNFEPTIRSCAAYRLLDFEEYSDIEQDTGVVSLVAECSFNGCQEAYAICGSYHTEMADDNNGQEFEISVCHVNAVVPTLEPINIPAQCPENVRAQFRSAFSIMWLDPNPALNRVRTALELLLDHFKVSRTRVVVKKGTRKRARLDLHNRIEKFGTQRKSVADLIPSLLAVKYLGNDGTHDTTADADDFFDALDLSENLLSRLFDPNHTTNAQLTDEVLKRKGRRKRKKT